MIPRVPMPVHRPRYNNLWLRNFTQWYRDNEPLLSEYFRTLGQYLSQEDDFFSFAVCQHDIELYKSERK